MWVCGCVCGGVWGVRVCTLILDVLRVTLSEVVEGLSCQFSHHYIPMSHFLLHQVINKSMCVLIKLGHIYTVCVWGGGGRL